MGDEIVGNVTGGYINLRRLSRMIPVSSKMTGLDGVLGVCHCGGISMSVNNGDALRRINESTLNSTSSFETRTTSPSGNERNSRCTGVLSKTTTFAGLGADIGTRVRGVKLASGRGGA